MTQRRQAKLARDVSRPAEYSNGYPAAVGGYWLVQDANVGKAAPLFMEFSIRHPMFRSADATGTAASGRGGGSAPPRAHEAPGQDPGSTLPTFAALEAPIPRAALGFRRKARRPSECVPFSTR